MVLLIDDKLKEAKEKDKRFFRVEEFKRNVKRVDSFASSCPFCSRHKTDIREVVDEIDVAIDQPGRKRRKYDKLIGNLATHMQKEHHFYTPLHFTYSYTFYGIMAGVAAGIILSVIMQSYSWPFLSISMVLGMIWGYLKGGRKDSKIRSTNKLM